MCRTSDVASEWSLSLPRLAVIAFALTLAGAWPAGADWLVTQNGDEIETKGDWRIEDGWVHFIAAGGREDLLPIEDVDIEASERANVAPITLYMTTWCGYCRKARGLLEELDLAFEEKDVEKDQEAAEEHQALTGGRAGVPVIKVGSSVVLGFNAAAIEAAADQKKSWQRKRQQLEDH